MKKIFLVLTLIFVSTPQTISAMDPSDLSSMLSDESSEELNRTAQIVGTIFATTGIAFTICSIKHWILHQKVKIRYWPEEQPPEPSWHPKIKSWFRMPLYYAYNMGIIVSFGGALISSFWVRSSGE